MAKFETKPTGPEYLTAEVPTTDETPIHIEPTRDDLRNSARTLLETAILARYPHITQEDLDSAPVSEVRDSVDPNVFVVEINVLGRGYMGACNTDTLLVGSVFEF